MLSAVVSTFLSSSRPDSGLDFNTSSEILDAFLLPTIVGSVVGGDVVTRLPNRTITVVGLVLATIGAYTLTFFHATVGTSS